MVIKNNIMIFDRFNNLINFVKSNEKWKDVIKNNFNYNLVQKKIKFTFRQPNSNFIEIIYRHIYIYTYIYTLCIKKKILDQIFLELDTSSIIFI